MNILPAEIQSPLSEASATSLDELFDKDPLHLTDQDIEAICTELRRQRQHWLIEDRAKQNKVAKPGKSKAAAAAALDISDILDL